MAEEKTKKYFVRLVKGFPMAQGHRRAGFTFLPGPTPQEVELTSEQRELIEQDPSLEFVSSKDASKLTEATEDLNDVADPGLNATAKAGRNYDTGVNGGLADTATVITKDNQGENQNNNIGNPGGGDAGAADDTAATADDASDATEDGEQAENLSDLKRDELNQRAVAAGVEKPEDLPNKQAVIEAIEARSEA